jgi:hypothetical protein
MECAGVDCGLKIFVLREGSVGAPKHNEAASKPPASNTAIPAALLRSFRIWSKRPMNGYSASCEVRPKIQGTSQPKPAGPAALMKRDLLPAYGMGIIARCQSADKCPVTAIGLGASARMCRVIGSERATDWSSQLVVITSRAQLDSHSLIQIFNSGRARAARCLKLTAGRSGRRRTPC